MAQRQFKLVDIKTELSGEEGTFTGYLSVYDVVDAGNDVVCKGAFTKTISDQKGRIPLLWSHSQEDPIGYLDLQDDAKGLRVKGTLLLGIQKAKEAYILLKSEAVSGLSIGFKALQKSIEEGTRFLKELRLFEGSVCVFPMNDMARVDGVKSIADGTGDFTEEFDEAMTAQSGCMAIGTLASGLSDAWWSIQYAGYFSDTPAPDPKALVAFASDYIDQFKAVFIPALEKYAAMMATEEPEVGKSIRMKAKLADLERKAKAQAPPVPAPPENKAGARISAETAGYMKTAADHLSAAMSATKSAHEVLSTLMAPPAADESTGDKSAAGDKVEPEILPLSLSWLDELKSLNETFKGIQEN